MGNFRQKRIWISEKNYVTVRLYDLKKDMQEFYSKARPKDRSHFSVLGVHMGHIKYKREGKKHIMHEESGIVLLNREHVGPGIVSHELMHAVLWGWRLHMRKKQYPIIIKNHNEEEKLLLRHTVAVALFYRWFWTINEEIDRYVTIKRKN